MKQYRNAERTKKWIRKAFIELLAEKKKIEKISVTELSERADISKTTFYYHYADIYAVVAEMENELINVLMQAFQDIEPDDPGDYEKYIQKAVSFIKENEESYRWIVLASDFSSFAERLKRIFTELILNLHASWGLSQNYERRSVQVFFLVSACVDTIIEYLKGDLPVSIDILGQGIAEVIEKIRRNS